MTWERVAIGIAILLALGAGAIGVWWKRSAMTRVEAMAYVKSLGGDVARLPGRLRRVANDPRTPRRARWWLIGLAVYVASPIDPLPDFIPVIGQLDELVIVPLVIRHVRKMIPADVWTEHFPPHPNRQTGRKAAAPTR